MENLPLKELFGDIDIYLFDQLLKGRLNPKMKVLDAGCGYGRNLCYLLRSGYDVYGVDQAADAIAHLRKEAAERAPKLPPGNFQAGSLDRLSFESGTFDAVLCNAVLHFAPDEQQFQTWLAELWRVLKVGGIFFSRLASDIGIESRVDALGSRRFRLPDGSTRFLVNESMLLDLTQSLGGELLDPIKTTNVQNLRCMTTWCLQKLSKR